MVITKVIVDRRELAKTVLKRFNAQYAMYEDTFEFKSGGRVGATREALMALGENPDPDKVDAIMGNTSWTAPCKKCAECRTYNEYCARIGTQMFCETCLLEAARVARQETA